MVDEVGLAGEEECLPRPHVDEVLREAVVSSEAEEAPRPEAQERPRHDVVPGVEV